MAIIDEAMTPANLATAQTHIHNVCSMGNCIYLIAPGTKDEFGTIISDEDALELKAFPVRLSPYDRNTLQKISWAEDTDILCYISKKDIDNLDMAIETLRRTYTHVRFNGKKYSLRYVECYSAFADDFLYIVVGGKK